MRLFFALWPPPETARALGEWAREVQKTAGGRLTPVENIHLTLAYLGEADPERAIRAAKRVTAEPFDLPIDTAKYWPKNQILWVGPQTTPPGLLTLVERLQMELFREEFILERRPFAAHITLLRKANRPTSIPPLPVTTWPAPEYALVRSTMGGRSSAYVTTDRFTFGR